MEPTTNRPSDIDTPPSTRKRETDRELRRIEKKVEEIIPVIETLREQSIIIVNDNVRIDLLEKAINKIIIQLSFRGIKISPEKIWTTTK